MTDNEIIKALECCVKTEFISDCAKCEMFAFDCKDILIENALDLINRQKAEIEKLRQENEFCHKTITENAQRALEVTVEEIEKTKSETLKEFAERLKEKFGIADCIVTIDNDDIDNLVKEMTEVNENDRA